MNPKHILLTTDLSDEALRAFAPVAALASSLDVAITLLHVVEDVPIPAHGAPLAPPLHAPDVEATVAAAQAALEDQRAHIGEDLDVTSVVVKGSDVAKTVDEYADEHDVDLIAISTHGRSGFRRLVLGSVAEKVLRHAHVPVLVIPRPS